MKPGSEKFISLHLVGIRLDVENYVLRYWCDTFNIPRERNMIEAVYENRLLTIRDCLREERITIAETKKRLGK